jgi:hypothetical protein
MARTANTTAKRSARPPRTRVETAPPTRLEEDDDFFEIMQNYYESEQSKRVARNRRQNERRAIERQRRQLAILNQRSGVTAAQSLVEEMASRVQSGVDIEDSFPFVQFYTNTPGVNQNQAASTSSGTTIPPNVFGIFPTNADFSVDGISNDFDSLFNTPSGMDMLDSLVDIEDDNTSTTEQPFFMPQMDDPQLLPIVLPGIATMQPDILALPYGNPEVDRYERYLEVEAEREAERERIRIQRSRVVLKEVPNEGRVSIANPGEEFPNLTRPSTYMDRSYQIIARDNLYERHAHVGQAVWEGKAGLVGAYEMVLENRRTAVADPRTPRLIITAFLNALYDEYESKNILQPNFDQELWVRFNIEGRDRQNLSMQIPFHKYKLRGDLNSTVQKLDIQNMIEDFIAFYLSIINSPGPRKTKAREEGMEYSGEMNAPSDQGDFYEPMRISASYVMLLIPRVPDQARNDNNDQNDEGPDFDQEEANVDNNNQEQVQNRDRRNRVRGDRMLGPRRSQRISQLRTGQQGSIFSNGGQRKSARVQNRNRRVGSYFGMVEVVNVKGEFTLLNEERDPTIKPPPPPQFRLSIHAKKRRKQRNRIVCEKQETIMVNTIDGGLKVGAYEINNENELKFYKNSIEHIYNRKGLLHLTPETESKSCFLMSLVRSEVFTYVFDQKLNYIGKHRSGGDSVEEGAEKMFEIKATLPEWDVLDVNYSFVRYDETEENFIVCFMNRFISFDSNIQEYQCELSTQEKYYWELAARELEIYLLNKNPLLDVNDMESVGQTFSDAFQVIISIYDVEMFGERVWCFQPRTSSLEQMICHNHYEMHVVSLLYDRGHMYGLCNLMKYLSQNVKNTIDLNAYCPFCEQKGTRELRKKSGSKNHIQKCWLHYRTQNPCLKIYSLTDHKKKELEMGVLPVKMQYCAEYKCQTNCCVYCHEPVEQEQYIFHQCKITCRAKKDKLEKSQLYVYDLEAAQIPVPHAPQTYYHVCNMVCFRKMYPETEEERKGVTFADEYSFMDYVLNKHEGIVIIAHNGGSYDHQFVVRYMERLQIQHTFIPSPSTNHKFLSVHVYEKNIQFLDFIYFLPGSLRSISESMNIETLKGDFPHRFNTVKEIDYEGSIPPMDTEDDFWCLRTKRNMKEVNEMKQFFSEQCLIYCTCDHKPLFLNRKCTACGKKTWLMKEVMQHYCMQDVIVLGNCCAKYREELLEMENEDETGVGWKPVTIDPFQYLTVPQLALNILIQGYEVSPFTNMKSKIRLGQCLEAIDWLEIIMKKQSIHIHHRLNSSHEYYDFDMCQFADGYEVETKTPYVCLDCNVWGCENCHYHKMHYQPTLMHPYFPSKNYMEVYELTEAIIYQWISKGGIVVRKCEIVRRDVSEFEKKCYEMHPMASFFYGGRTEVFQLYYNARATEDQKLQYHDVCSLYPYVCAFKDLPNGEPTFILGTKIETHRVFHSDTAVKYWGFISCRIRPNPNCLIGFLPSRKEGGRLQFSLDEQDGCWGLDELEFAWKQGYQIVEIYGIIHWDVDQRSNQLFRPYVDFFLRMKQEAEGWKKLGARENDPPTGEQDRIIEQLFVSNGHIGRIRKDRVKKNPVKRMLAKLFLNSLWGKFAQKPENKVHTTIYGLKQFFRIWNDKQIDQASIEFRQTNAEIFKVVYEVNNEFIRSNSRGNIALAAKVTEHARCELHKQMVRIGPERIIYCDTDSLVFHWQKNGEDLTGIGLGKWTNEYPNEAIWEFYALAPKLYYLVMESDNHCLKVKGIQPSIGNVNRLDRNAFRMLIADGVMKTRTPSPTRVLWMDYMSIYANCQRNLGLNYGVMVTRYGKKVVQLVITKRKIVKLDSLDWNTLVQIKTTPLNE